MNEIEFIQSLIVIGLTGGPQTPLAFFAYLIWAKLSKLQKNFEVLNHNTSQITKALLARKVIEPDDIQDVNL